MNLRTVTLILVFGAVAACQSMRISPTKDNESPDQPSSEVPSPTVSQTYPGQAKKYHSMENQIRLASSEVGIENLSDSIHHKELEVRIWVGFGLTHVRCFILYRQNGEFKAEYRTITTIRGPTEVGREEKIVKNVLSIPKSGWITFSNYLKDQGIESPLRLGNETDYIPDPDGQIIAIEVRSGTEYDMVFFHVDNKNADAQKAIDVCRRTEDEFDIALHCTPGK